MNPFNRLESYLESQRGRKSDISETIRRIQEETKKTQPGTDEFARLRSNMEQELRNKKLYKEMQHFGLKPDTILIVLMVIMIAGYGFALDLESPKALKIAQFVLKLPGVKIG